MTVDQIIASVSAVGTVMAASATFLTIRELQRQRRSSYRPDLVVLPGTFFLGTKDDIDSVSAWRNRSSKDENDPTGLRVRIENIGVGAARNVKVRMSIDYQDLIRVHNELAALVRGRARMELAEEKIKVGDDYWYARNAEVDISFILPASQKAPETYLDVPNGFAWAISRIARIYAVAYKTVDFSVLISKQTAPQIFMTIEHRDIGGELHEINYQIWFALHGIGDHGFCCSMMNRSSLVRS